MMKRFPFPVLAAIAAVPLLTTGCSTFFSRSNSEAEKAAKNDGRETYSASESDSDSADLKVQKIHHLESTVTSLNTRIRELEGKLQAAEARVPEPSAAAKAKVRQTLDTAALGSRISATVAPNDPGAGFVNDAAVRAFQQGKLLFDQEKFPESILAFSAFLEGNPNHPLASSAQYTIGEAYYREGDFAVADTEFQKLTTRYPQSPRVSYALVRLSQSAAALGKNDEAKRYQTQVEGLFPKSPALKLLRESPVPSSAANADLNETPIATAPELSIERPAVPMIEKPSIEAPTVEAPHIEAPASNAPRARVGESNGDLDAPPGAGG